MAITLNFINNMDKSKAIEILKFLVENGQNIFFICILVLSWIGFFRFIKSYHWKIYQSMKGKQVRFIKTDEKDFDQEKMVLKNSQIVKMDEYVLDYSKVNSAEDLKRKLSSIEDNSLIVIEYSDKFIFYREILEAVYEQNLPIVIYVTSRMSDQNDREIKNSKHAYIEICNTSVRLLQAIINLCLAHK